MKLLPKISTLWSGPKDGGHGTYYRLTRYGRTNLTTCEILTADNLFHAKMLAELDSFK